ncbi:phosphoribosyltransferase [Sporolactobacillus shoreicorticis]|uniref:Phosphoribosyltransferase n=1 Tax=Sporolactobacillus shoreicorticis TaxID=1923877 RepID=A0ABW5RY24_9BACL|nr:phosphoribosyltransferase [Sporolactobacillus shoreicorticis]MCO7124765.1 phosphoribosyltransferase [Sporolactobacillus shoreicorticis]
MYIIMSRLTVFDEDYNMYAGIKHLLNCLNEEGHRIIVISHNTNAKNTMKDIFKEQLDFKIACAYRWKIREIVTEENASSFVLVGSSDNDLILAANKKILIIDPGWSVKQEEKPARYGIILKTPRKLLEAIKLIDNQTKWFFKLKVNSNTTTLALTSANTLNWDVEPTEREVLDGFQNLLKRGDRSYFNTLYFHLISGVMKSSDLRNVDIWGIFPTSSGKVNNEMEELKERCRYLTNKRMKEPLFIRHTSVNRSHDTPYATRIKEGCIKHFNSIILNPFYLYRVKGKVVCVLDDYITNGISFETARNLLIKAGAQKVILVALGRYKRGINGIYQQEDYEIDGNITRQGYRYNLKSKKNLTGVYDNDAREEVRHIYEILND